MIVLYAVLAVAAAGILPGAGLASAEIPEVVKIGGIFEYNWAEGAEGAYISEMAVDDFNAYLENIGAGWSFRLSAEDTQSSTAVSLDKIQAFNSVGVKILVGLPFSAYITQATSYIDRNNMLVVSHASQAADLAIDDTVFRLVPHDGYQAPAITKMLEDAGIEVLVTVSRGDTWGDGHVSGVRALFNGTMESGFRYNTEASEFSVTVGLLDEAIADLVERHGAEKVGVLYVGNDEFLPIMQAMRFYENVSKVRWFATHTQSFKTYFFEDPAASAFAEATQITATRSIPTGDNKIKDALDARYMEMYDAPVSTYGYAAYDAIWLLGLTILQTQSTDAETMASAMPHVASHMLGASGDLTLTEYGDLATANFEVWQVSNGAWIQVQGE
jgi:ABC-type branched-subunit amino acid transport system substrate-binding protein